MIQLSTDSLRDSTRSTGPTSKGVGPFWLLTPTVCMSYSSNMKLRPTVILNQTANWGTGIPGLTGDEVCIVLTQGYLSLIDAEHDDELSAHAWRADLSSTQQVRAKRHGKRDQNGHRLNIMIHREVSKPLASQEVDHRDQHKFFCHKIVDNRRANLRNVSTSQNQANQRKQVGCSSCYKGVSWHKNIEKWMAYIKLNNKRICLGYFASQEEAAQVYNEAHQIHFPGITEGLNKLSI